MKLLILLALGVFLTTNVSIAQENDGKRPSWSQGLPERKKVPVTNIQNQLSRSTSLNETETVVEPELEVDFNFSHQPEQIIAPDSFKDPVISSRDSIENGFVSSSPLETDSTSEQNTVEGVEIDLDPVVSGQTVQMGQTEKTSIGAESEEMAEARLNTLVAKEAYTWEVKRMLPVELPKNLASTHHDVLMKIAINPNGRVIEIEPVLDDTSQAVIRHARRFIQQWRFEPPKNQGFTLNQSRVFKVALQAKS